MVDVTIIERIDAWERAGLIDVATAARLRAAEEAEPISGPVTEEAAVAPGGARSSPAALVMGLVGAGFVLAAWYWAVGRVTTDTGADPALVFGIGAGLAALVCYGLGSIALGRGASWAGLILLAGTAQVGATVALLAMAVGGDGPDLPWATPFVLGSLAALAAAAIVRRGLADRTTAAGVAGALGVLAISGARMIEDALFPVHWTYDYAPVDEAGLARPIVLAGWWLLMAVVALLYGEREARTAAPGGAARAGVGRFVAAAIGVLGSASALLGGSLGWNRALEPVVGEALVIAIAAAFVVLSLRTGSAALLAPVALGLVIALSDFNAAYVLDELGQGPALLLEGLALIAVGFVVERTWRRVRGVTAPARAG